MGVSFSSSFQFSGCIGPSIGSKCCRAKGIIQLLLSILGAGLFCSWGMSISALFLFQIHRQRIQSDDRFLILTTIDAHSTESRVHRGGCEIWLSCPFCADHILVCRCGLIPRGHDDRILVRSCGNRLQGISGSDVEF